MVRAQTSIPSVRSSAAIRSVVRRVHFNELLKQQRGVSFEEVVFHIQRGDEIEHSFWFKVNAYSGFI